MSQSHQSKVSTSRRRLIKAALAGIVAPAVLRIGPAFAAYPDRPVRIVVANTPGGPSDIIARIMAAAMQEAMPGSSIIVENKGGGGGNIGMGYVARSDADGYTILLSTSAYSVNPGLYNTPPYDPFKDFSAVCELAVSPHVFAVMPDLGVKIDEGVRRARQDQSRQVQRLHAADRNHAATPGRSAEAARRAAEDGDHRLPRRRRRAQGAALGHRAAQLRRAGARPSADQGRQHQGPCGHRPDALARPAGYSDHGRVGLPGFRIRHLYRADGTGEDSARDREPAGKGRARDSQQARHASAI